MKKKNGNVFLELVRPLNCVMAAFGVFVGYSIALQGIAFSLPLTVAMAAAFFVCAFGQAINDVFDSKVDEKLHPEKPIPSKRVSKKTAAVFSVVLAVTGIALAVFLPIQSFIIAIFFACVLFAYSAKMQKAKYLGNWIVALGTGFTLVFGASLLGNYLVVGVLALSALLANAAREIIKDTEDINADSGIKVSLPMILGKSTVKAAVGLLYLLAVAISFFAFFFMNFGNALFFVLTCVSAGIFAYSAMLFFKGDLGAAQAFSKAGMLVALMGFLGGVL